jgi:beta-fructofuranosidase
MKTKSATLLLLFIISGNCHSAEQTNNIRNISATPQYTFATTLAEQQAELKSNPLMLRFAESRKKQTNDPHRPVYHLVSPESLMNDPNGLTYWKGSWHLFYQGYPTEENKRAHWAHAVSEDLIHWRDLPYALYPGPEEQCFSGNILIEEDRAIAIYHGRNFGNITAISSDPLLLNWEKKYKEGYISVKIGQSVDKSFAGTKGEAGLTNISVAETATETKKTIPEGSYIFDPCIWRKGDYYYSLSGCGVPKGPGGKRIPTELLFRSKDLIKWDYLHEFSEGDRFSYIGDTRHCPNFEPIGNKYMLSYFGSASGAQYLLGDYDKERDKFVVTSHGRFNYGAIHPGGIHAPAIQSDGKGGVIVICNVNAGMVTGEWDHLMTLPRRMTLDGGDNVLIEPVKAVESLRYDGKQIEKMILPANKEIVLENIKGKAIEIIAEVDLTAGRKKGDFQNQALPSFTYKDPAATPLFEMNVLRSPDKKEYTRIAFYSATAVKGTNRNESSWITLDNSCSSTLPGAFSRAPETAPVILKEGEPLQLRVFVDHSIVEVFVNGKQCISARVYPGLEGSEGVSVRSAGLDAVLNSLSAYQMKSIY